MGCERISPAALLLGRLDDLYLAVTAGVVLVVDVNDVQDGPLDP